jgi:phosphate transport system substrate-binding protein
MRGVAGRTELTGAGATLPYPCTPAGSPTTGARTGVRINYQAIGSGGGIRQLAEGHGRLRCDDVPMTRRELAGRRAGGVLHVPTLVGAVAITYNLPGPRRAAARSRPSCSPICSSAA